MDVIDLHELFLNDRVVFHGWRVATEKFGGLKESCCGREGLLRINKLLDLFHYAKDISQLYIIYSDTSYQNEKSNKRQLNHHHVMGSIYNVVYTTIGFHLAVNEMLASVHTHHYKEEIPI
ncbi:predicted protein [Lichtheimia corymbifera JMRC:FSU:9682]|uniref:Uncharacterized protein n=1 Tax=Lichtheimia corymbifera JMRC:FSU:9682 TaxID=1263082 RepID=A0A068S9B0_9FUNG|nr:predicted protein [Lichtheimia corymbifera JMRC:FSU:9682]